jgi:hypothetical protein
LKNVSEDTQILVYIKTIKHILTLKAKESKRNDGGGQVKNNLFEKVQFNASNSKQKEIITKSINNFPNKDRAFYILMEELSYGNRFDNSKFEFNAIRNTMEYKQEMEANSYLFRLSPLSDSIYINFFQKFIRYIELFGANSIFVEYHFYFKQITFFSYINSYLLYQLSPQNINGFHKNLEILDNKSLTKIKLLGYLIKNKNHIYSRFEKYGIQYLLDTIEQVSEIEKVINLILLKNVFNYKIFNNDDTKKIDDFNTTLSIKNLINKILNAEYSEALKIIIEELKITDKQILSL